MIEVRTSDPRWFEQMAKAYKRRQPGVLVDDAKLGVKPSGMALRNLAALAEQQARNPAAGSLTIGFGIVAMIGTVLGLFALYERFTGRRPPNAKIKFGGIGIEWNFEPTPH